MRSPTITHSAEELLDKLATLGSADQIASFLEEQKIVGVPCRASGCAIANYLTRETGLMASVGESGGRLFEPGVKEQIQWDCNGPIGEFIRAFDNGQYPNLIDGFEVN